jgi:hypothetical protein
VTRTRARGFGLPRSACRDNRRQARRLNRAGFSFGFGGLGKLLLLLRLTLGRRRRSRPIKSGGPPLFEPSFKVQGYAAHNRNSGFAVLPRCYGLNARGARKVPAGNQKRPPVRRRGSTGPCQPASRTHIGESRRPGDRPGSAQFDCGSRIGLNHSATGAYCWDERETQISFENDQGRSLDRCRKHWICPRLACREFRDRGRG